MLYYTLYDTNWAGNTETNRRKIEADHKKLQMNLEMQD